MEAVRGIDASSLCFQLLNHSVAQILLVPTQTVSVDVQSVVYYSSRVKSAVDDAWKLENGSQAKQRRLMSNKGSSFEYLAVGLHGGGPITVLNPCTLCDEGLLLRSSSLICCFQVSTLPLSYPLHSFRLVTGSGLAFVQVQSLLIEKVLGDGEEMDLPEEKLIGYSKSVLVNKAERNNSKWWRVRGGWKMVTAKGPGIVYTSAHQSKPPYKPTFTPLDILLLSIFLYSPSSLCSIALAYIKKLLKNYEGSH